MLTETNSSTPDCWSGDPDGRVFFGRPIPPEVIVEFYTRGQERGGMFRVAAASTALALLGLVLVATMASCTEASQGCSPLVKITENDIVAPQVVDGEVTLRVRVSGATCDAYQVVAVITTGAGRFTLVSEQVGVDEFDIYVPVRDGQDPE